MKQVEVSTGEERTGLNHRIDAADYLGKLAFTMSVQFTVAYEREGDYRYDFYLNGIKRGETAVRVSAIRS